MKQSRKWVISALIFFLTACSYNPFISNNHTTGNPAAGAVGAIAAGGIMAHFGASKPIIAISAITGGMFGYYVSTLRHDAGAIIYAGGKVYKIGDYVGIYLPSDSLFEPNTAELLPQARVILKSVEEVLERYPTNNIIISGNTSGFYHTRWEQRLSEKRAQVVSAYLWDNGINNFRPQAIDTRKLNYVGYGDYFPIANVYTNEGIRDNSRIQITSYPSDCDLRLGKINQPIYNVAAVNDRPMVETAERCGKDDENCFEYD